MESSNQFLGTERIGKLMQKYAIPCIISLLVGALYNIVDQIFIANARRCCKSSAYKSAATKRRTCLIELSGESSMGQVPENSTLLDR